MIALPVRAVFDCVVFLQGAGRRTNAARRCLELVELGSVQLCLSPEVLAEIEDVLGRPELVAKFPLISSSESRQLLQATRGKSLLFADVASAFRLPRDPDDEAYVNLAIAAEAEFLVTWNERHLTYLMRRDTPEGIEFCSRFPKLKIVNPPTFLQAVRAAS